MKWTGTHAGIAWTTKNRRDIRAPAVTALGSIVCKQIETGGDEVDKLKLGNSLHSHQTGPASRTHNCRFRNRRVNYAAFAKFINQAVGHLEGAAVIAHV